MCKLGDIVQIFGATAGHKKYHLCICESDEHSVCKFLFINSHEGWEGDFVLSDIEIPCLPKSPTGKSVISCNNIAKYNKNQRDLFKAKTLGVIDKAIVEKLLSHVSACRTFSRSEKALIKLGLEKLI